MDIASSHFLLCMLLLRGCDGFHVENLHVKPDVNGFVGPASDSSSKLPTTSPTSNIQLLLMQYSAAVLTARKLRSNQLKKAQQLEQIRLNSNRRRFGIDDESLIEKATVTIPDMSSISFPFGDMFSTLPSLLVRDIPAKDRRAAASLLHDGNFMYNVDRGLTLIEDSVLEFAPFPLNHIFHWWTSFRGFNVDSRLLPPWEESVQKLTLFHLREEPWTFDEVTLKSAAKLLPFPFNFYCQWKNSGPKVERLMKYTFIDNYDDAGITAEEADHRIMAMIAPWLPWPWNKLAFVVLPFRAHQQERRANASMEGSHYSFMNDGEAMDKWHEAVETSLKEAPSDRQSRGLLGLFGLSPLQFFPMLTPLNLFGKSFNSSGPRPFTLQIFLPSNKTVQFSNSHVTEVNVTSDETGETIVHREPNYKLDLKYYYKVYPSPPPPSKFNPDVYYASVNKQVSDALATFSASPESTTQPMDSSETDGGKDEGDFVSYLKKPAQT